MQSVFSPLSRRAFLQQSLVVTLGFTALRGAVERGARASSAAHLVSDPEGILDLPPGFSYHVFSKAGDLMDDGLLVPGKQDGMGVFPGENGKTILVRNHELDPGAADFSPFGKDRRLMKRVDLQLLYDSGNGDRPGLGGTTTLLYDTRTKRLERQFLSLCGTYRNCAGGITPWNSWISCEEDTTRPNLYGTNPDDPMQRAHGYNFEVPADLNSGLIPAIPLKAMGRFRHEAVAVDPRTGIVYQTEDQTDGLFYRFIPNKRGKLLEGGRLQALKLKDAPRADTRNFWSTTFRPGNKLKVEWVDVRNVESPDDDLRYQVFFNDGAARFARGEGIWYGSEAFYFACTNGGHQGKGQIWKYTPSASEGKTGEKRNPGILELFIEPNDGTLVENCDNLTIAPWGDLIVCEDGKNPQYLVGVTMEGELYKFARTNLAEFAGACFSLDGTTLFVNIMTPGLTLAITGPWDKLKQLTSG